MWFPSHETRTFLDKIVTRGLFVTPSAIHPSLNNQRHIWRLMAEGGYGVAAEAETLNHIARFLFCALRAT